MLLHPTSEGLTDFIPAAQIEELLQRPPAEAPEVRKILAKSLSKQRLELPEMAALLSVTDPALQQELFDAARLLKRTVYGNRIVLFAPLYIGNECMNDCQYCAFRRSNRDQIRRTLDEEEIREETTAAAIKAVIAGQLANEMKKKKITKQRMAELMKTSRAQVDRLLDPHNGSATIESLQRAARIVGRELRMQLV